MRILAVDFGEKRIGLAVSDESGEIVVPVGVVSRRSDAQAASDVTAAAREREVELVVVGLPVSPEDGRDSAFAARARNFARRLAEASGLPVALHGEALTSHFAEATLRDAGASRARRQAGLDAESAAAILRDWLSSHPDGRAT